MRAPVGHRRHRLFAAALGPVLAAGITSAADADRGRYVLHSLTERANPGLTVSKPLDQFRAVSRARVVVPAEWRRLHAKPGLLRFITPRSNCRYQVVFSVASRLAAPRSAVDHVADALPSPSASRLLDSGQRGNSAFRVIHEQGKGAVVSLRALWAGVLTRRADIAPAGQIAWSELGVTAASRPGDECHSGTWRDVLGPQLGDALATARTRLAFVRPR